MSDYYNRKNTGKKGRSKKEKIGFYTAFSICLAAVCMAVYSTYTTLSDKADIQTVQVQEVDNNVTGVTETVAAPTIGTIAEAIPKISTETTTEESQSTTEGSETALETMLSTDLSLTYPLKSNNILRGYSEESVYFKTLNVWKPHTGVDFLGSLGDDVFAMTSGTVTKISEDRFYGKTVEISTNDAVCIYSGLGRIDVKEGESVSANGVIGVIGSVPFEASDPNHIHVSVKIGDNYADPLSFIGNNE